MKKQRRMGHTVSVLSAHIVWVTKYRFQVLNGDIQVRCRYLVKQICDTEDVRILKGVISKDHLGAFKKSTPSLVKDIGVDIFGL